VSDAVVLAPVAAGPVVAERVVTEPLVSDAVVPAPVAAGPVVAERVVTEPLVFDAVVPVPVAPDPVVSDPVASDRVLSDCVVSDPVASDPVVLDRVVSESVVPEFVVPRPAVPERVVAEPVVSEMVVPRPVVADRVVAGPIVSERVEEFTPADDKRLIGSPDEAHGPAPVVFAAATASVMELLAPLKPGDRVHDWTFVAAHDVSMGAVPVILADKHGKKFQVDILRRDRQRGAPLSVADTPTLSLFLANEGHGNKASDEAKGLGVVALATVLGKQEKRAMPAGLLTWRQRLSRFPKGEYKTSV